MVIKQTSTELTIGGIPSNDNILETKGGTKNRTIIIPINEKNIFEMNTHHIGELMEELLYFSIISA